MTLPLFLSARTNRDQDQTPAHFDQLERARRCEQASILNRKAYDPYGRHAGRAEEEEVWTQTAKLFHKTFAEAFPAKFDDHFDLLKQGI